jgi:dynein heavy chain 1
MGGLLFPEAYLTATRQYVAQNNKWSLEELDLRVTIDENEPMDEDSFLLSGIIITGAKWSLGSKHVETTEELSYHLPTLRFRWVRVDKADRGIEGEDEILVPVYLNKSRKNLLFSVKLNSGKIPRTILYQKGLALITCDN